MLVTLNTLIKAWSDECKSMSDIATTEWVIGNVVAIGFNMAMLHGGFRVESGRVLPEGESAVLLASCLPFVFSFLPSVVFVTESYSGHGLAVLILTFCVWSMYAVNAMRNRDDTEAKASVYNLLDVPAPTTAHNRPPTHTLARTDRRPCARRSSRKTSTPSPSRCRC